jgi:hypothetical protein
MTNQIPEDDFNEAELFRPVPVAASSNPLAGYFRMPGLHVPLPTRGAFLPKEDYDPTLAGDVPVFPMKAADELLLRSPDALMSGMALEELVRSCVPSIRRPRLISTPDLDVILLAIRAATYGENMEVEVICPECKHENVFDCHLPSMMGRMTFINPVNEARLSDDIIVTLRPYNLETATLVAMESFNEARRLQGVADELAVFFEDGSSAEEKEIANKRMADARNESFRKMSKINIDAISSCVISVAVPTGAVTDRANISEFINNTSQSWVKKIEKKLDELNSAGIDKHVDAACAKCEHKWTPEIEFDPTSFFDNGS